MILENNKLRRETSVPCKQNAFIFALILENYQVLNKIQH